MRRRTRISVIGYARITGKPDGNGLETTSDYLAQYLETADLKCAPKSPLFGSVAGRTRRLSENAMTQPDVYRMIRRRAAEAGIETKIGCHTFRATGITAYLKNGGRLEVAQQIAAHESSARPGCITGAGMRFPCMRSSGS